MKKVFKWILRVFLFILLLGSSVGVYFYFFPSYADYDISEEYFETRFHNEGFDSPENGFEDWENLIEGLDQYSETLSEFDMYYKCYIENNCLLDLGLLDTNERKVYLDDFLESEGYNITFSGLLKDTILGLDTLKNQKYINTHDYEDHKKLLIGGEVKPVLTYTKLIQFSRSLLFYYGNSSNKEIISIFGDYYDSLTKLTHKMDGSIIEYTVLTTLLDSQLDYFIKNIENFNELEKVIFKNILEENEISDSMIENGIKREYQNLKLLFETFNSGDSLAGKESTDTIRKKLFYHHTDTLNLLGKSFHTMVTEKDIFNISRNGRNLIGRIMLQTGQVSYEAQFKKYDELIKKREELIQLLSN